MRLDFDIPSIVLKERVVQSQSQKTFFYYFSSKVDQVSGYKLTFFQNMLLS